MRLEYLLLLALRAIAVTNWQSPADNTLTQQNPLLNNEAHCDCNGIMDTAPNATFYVCNNATLGPKLLPWRLPLLSLVSDYDRFGDLTPKQFLDKWWFAGNSSARATWIYPQKDGFQLDIDNNPIKGSMILRKGLRVDRFGDAWGRYISAADAPFSQRALPPDALNVCKNSAEACNPSDHPWSYHVYEVVEEFQVVGGPIAAAFEQPGGGVQFFLGENVRVRDLVPKYLKELTLSSLRPGPGTPAKCGKKPVNCVCERPQ